MHANALKLKIMLLTFTVTATLPACEDAEQTAGVLDMSTGSSGAGGDNTADAGPDAADEDAGPSTDGGDCDFSCQGECLAPQPDYFAAPRLVWFGADESQAPPCPPEAPDHKFTWHADPSIPAASCSACTCGPSTGYCALPLTIKAHAALCNQAAGATTFESNPPENWTGECSAENPIQPGISCNGQPCVQSVTVDPLSVTDEACVAFGTQTTPLEKATWTQTAKVCASSALGSCPPGEQCGPAKAAGFQQCIERPGIHDCPTEAYTERFVFYDALNDSRHCSPCTCGAPEGSYCAAWISLYADGACSGQSSPHSAWSNGPSCFDMTPPFWTIGAKAATEPVYQPGTCEAHGGELEGAVSLEGPRTLCCRPLSP